MADISVLIFCESHSRQNERGETRYFAIIKVTVKENPPDEYLQMCRGFHRTTNEHTFCFDETSIKELLRHLPIGSVSFEKLVLLANQAMLKYINAQQIKQTA